MTVLYEVHRFVVDNPADPLTDGVCAASAIDERRWPDPEDPPPGQFVVYLVLATNGCGGDDLGQASDGTEREVTVACP